MQHTFPYTDEAGKSQELVIDPEDDIVFVGVRPVPIPENGLRGVTAFVVSRAAFDAMVAEFAT